MSPLCHLMHIVTVMLYMQFAILNQKTKRVTFSCNLLSSSSKEEDLLTKQSSDTEKT